MSNQYLLDRKGVAYVVSGWAMSDEPIVRCLAYRVPEGASVALHDCDGRIVTAAWAYSGPRVLSYRTTTGLTRSFQLDLGKPADLIFDWRVAPPRTLDGRAIRSSVKYQDGAWYVMRKGGRVLAQQVDGEYLRGYLRGAFETERQSDVNTGACVHAC